MNTDTEIDGPGSTADHYRGTPAEIYERHFVPGIGLPCAEPLVNAVRPTAGERVVDVACGTGAATRLVAARVGPGGVVAGVDGHPGMLTVARAACADGIEWRQASADGLPFGDDVFDAAICSLGLQFFADRLSALREMRRVVVEGGRLAIGVPGPTPPMMVDLHDVLASRIGTDLAAFVHTVFDLDDPDRLAALCHAGGWPDATVETHVLTLHLDPPADFLWQYLLGTPLAEAVSSRLDSAGRADLEADIVERWQDYETDDGCEMSVELHIAVA